MRIASSKARNKAILEIDGADMRDFRLLDETKEEFPVGDLEIAIKSASVTSSMRNEIRPEHPL